MVNTMKFTKCKKCKYAGIYMCTCSRSCDEGSQFKIKEGSKHEKRGQN